MDELKKAPGQVEKVKVGVLKGFVDTERCSTMFRRFSEGTFFEGVSLDFEEVERVRCGCGAPKKVDGSSKNLRCGRCGDVVHRSKTGMDFLEFH